MSAIEGTIETLLAFNLEAITGLPLRLVRVASALDPSVDLVAVDALRRIHIFELKKKTVNAQAAAQLEQYLLRYVFADADEYLAGAMRDRHLSEESVTRALLGYFANERSDISGLKKLKQELDPDHPALFDDQGRPLTPYRWSRLGSVEKLERIHPALVKHAFDRGVTGVPEFEEIRRIAAERVSSLNLEDRVDAGLVARNRLVVWLVGKSFTDEALDRIRRWRAAGVDARGLRLSARHIDGEWFAEVRREVAAQRDSLEQQVLARAATEAREGQVRMGFYDVTSASSSWNSGGNLVSEPKVSIRYLGGQEVTVQSSPDG